METDVRQKIINAYKQLVKNDFYLLSVGVNERSITHKLAEYLQQQFPDYHVDCEYNKNLLGEKTVIPWEGKKQQLISEFEKCDTDEKRKIKITEMLENGVSIYPDIIIHHRGTQDNFIVIEAKKSDNNTGDDRGKLSEYKYKDGLAYQNAYFVTFPVGKDLKRLSEESIGEFVEEI